MSRSALARLSPHLLLASLVLTACAASPTTDGQDVLSPSVPGSGTEETTEDVDEVAEQESPLEPYLDVLYNRLSHDEALKLQMEADEAIAACMAGKGFDYTPRTEAYWAAERELAGVGAGDAELTSSREWAAENGYGINVSRADAAAELQAADPNLGYVTGLTETGQAAYFLALHGDQNSGGTDGGCAGDAETGGQPLSLSDRWAPLVASLEQMWGQLIPADPEAVAANHEWSECMADAGYPGLGEPEDAMALVVPQDDGAPSAVGGGGPGNAAALQTEIVVAMADVDCRTATDRDARMRAVTVAAETTFLEQNRAQLDALLAEAEQGQ